MSHFSIFQLEIQLLYAPLNADKQWKTKSHSSLSSRSVPLSRAMDSAIIILLPFSSSYAGEAHFEKETEEKVLPPLDKNARRPTSSRTLKRKRTPRLLFTAMVEKVNVV